MVSQSLLGLTFAFLCLSFIFFLASKFTTGVYFNLLLRIRGTCVGSHQFCRKSSVFHSFSVRPTVVQLCWLSPAITTELHWYRKLNPSQYFDRSSRCHSTAVSNMSWGSDANTITVTANYTISRHTAVPVMLNT